MNFEQWKAEARERLSTRTQGKWENEDYRGNGDWRSTGLIWARNKGDYHPGTTICQLDERKVTEENVKEFEANGQFICHAPSDLETALKVISHLESIVLAASGRRMDIYEEFKKLDQICGGEG